MDSMSGVLGASLQADCVTLGESSLIHASVSPVTNRNSFIPSIHKHLSRADYMVGAVLDQPQRGYRLAPVDSPALASLPGSYGKPSADSTEAL